MTRVKYVIDATKEQVCAIFTAAIRASGPPAEAEGMTPALLQFISVGSPPDISPEDIDDRFGLSVDYHWGRMIKLNAKQITEGRWEFSTRSLGDPHGDYQSWARKFPTFEALFATVPGLKFERIEEDEVMF